jgi:hypothetical protein
LSQGTAAQELQIKAEARLASLMQEQLVTRISVLSTLLGGGGPHAKDRRKALRHVGPHAIFLAHVRFLPHTQPHPPACLAHRGRPYTKRGSHGGKMRGSRTTLRILLVASITCGSVQAAPRQPACIEIMASCEQAGFVRGDAKAGDRLFMDCVIPILRATPERSRASKPLPQVDPKLVADCKAQNPNFGQRVARPPQPGEPAMQASPAPQESPTHERTKPSSEAAEPPLQSRPSTPPPQAPPSSPTINGDMEE